MREKQSIRNKETVTEKIKVRKIITPYIIA